jgi:hypothetical protein
MEPAMLFIALVTGIMQGVQTWLALRDRTAARRAQERAYIQTLQAPETRNRAERLMAIVPLKTIDLLRRRVQNCYDRFNKMLENDKKYFPQDLSEAAEKALPNCVCTNLKMIIDVPSTAIVLPPCSMAVV